MIVSLKKLREKTGLTQHEVAKKLHVDGQFISNIERGVAPLPPKHYPMIAEMYDVTIKELINFQCRRYRIMLKKKILWRR